MTDLVTCVGAGKGTWATLYKLIEAESWDKIIFITNTFGKEKFKCPKNGEMIVVDENELSVKNVIYLVNSLQGKISYDTIAVNITSGNGKQHMEILGSMMKLGANFRLVSLDGNSIVEI